MSSEVMMGRGQKEYEPWLRYANRRKGERGKRAFYESAT